MRCLDRKHSVKLLLWLLPIVVSAADLRVEWSRLPISMVTGRNVDVDVDGGFRLKGKAIAVSTEGLQMEVADVQRPFDSLRDSKYQRGVGTVKKADILSIHVHKNRIRGRILGAITGGAIAGGVGGFSYLHSVLSEGSADSSVLTAASVGLVAGGYLLGWMSDRGGVTSIFIVPPPR